MVTKKDPRIDELEAIAEKAAQHEAAMDLIRANHDEPHAKSHDVPEWKPSQEWLDEQDRLSAEMRKEAEAVSAAKAPAEPAESDRSA